MGNLGGDVGRFAGSSFSVAGVARAGASQVRVVVPEEGGTRVTYARAFDRAADSGVAWRLGSPTATPRPARRGLPFVDATVRSSGDGSGSEGSGLGVGGGWGRSGVGGDPGPAVTSPPGPTGGLVGGAGR
jgi:hypothetical protein